MSGPSDLDPRSDVLHAILNTLPYLPDDFDKADVVRLLSYEPSRPMLHHACALLLQEKKTVMFHHSDGRRPAKSEVDAGVEPRQPEPRLLRIDSSAPRCRRLNPRTAATCPSPTALEGQDLNSPGCQPWVRPPPSSAAPKGRPSIEEVLGIEVDTMLLQQLQELFLEGGSSMMDLLVQDVGP
jgi:hypothetical protein